jgi:hypothetical protein
MEREYMRTKLTVAACALALSSLTTAVRAADDLVSGLMGEYFALEDAPGDFPNLPKTKKPYYVRVDKTVDSTTARMTSTASSCRKIFMRAGPVRCAQRRPAATRSSPNQTTVRASLSTARLWWIMAEFTPWRNSRARLS